VSSAISIRSNRVSATIDLRGATLVGLWADGDSLLAGPGRVEPARGHHGAVLAPWPNRLAHGRYTANQVDYAVPSNDPRFGHAIHGLVYDRVWRLVHRDEVSVALSHTLGSDLGYPFRVTLTVEYRVTAAGLRVHSRWENLGTNPAPFGLGFHPYLRPGPSPISDWTLSLQAQTVLGTDPETALPAKLTEIGDSPHDFRRPRPVGEDRFSVAYRRNAAEVTQPVVLTDPRGWSLTLRTSADFHWIQVFSGHLPDSALTRHGLAIEPQTCPANAFVTNQDLITVFPGESGTATWSLDAART
jgi:aldose 1-epimerase